MKNVIMNEGGSKVPEQILQKLKSKWMRNICLGKSWMESNWSRDAKQERSQLGKCSLQVSNYHCHCFSWLATCTHFMHTLCNFGPELTTSKLRWSKVAKRSCTHFMQTHMHCYFWPELATMRTPSYIHTTYKQDAREDDVSDEVGDDEEELDEGGWN